MLACGCGWVGVNLKPDNEKDVARCPSCGTVFKGYTAKDAVIVTKEREEVAVRQYNILKGGS